MNNNKELYGRCYKPSTSKRKRTPPSDEARKNASDGYLRKLESYKDMTTDQVAEWLSKTCVRNSKGRLNSNVSRILSIRNETLEDYGLDK